MSQSSWHKKIQASHLMIKFPTVSSKIRKQIWKKKKKKKIQMQLNVIFQNLIIDVFIHNIWLQVALGISFYSFNFEVVMIKLETVGRKFGIIV